MDWYWSKESKRQDGRLQGHGIGKGSALSQLSSNPAGSSIKSATTTINGVVINFSESGPSESQISVPTNSNVVHLSETSNPENLGNSSKTRNPGVVRRDVSFRQQCNSSGDKRQPHNVVGGYTQTSVMQTSPSISNVTSVERARARALQAVNYYNSSVLGGPVMESPAHYSGEKQLKYTDSIIICSQYSTFVVIMCGFYFITYI